MNEGKSFVDRIKDKIYTKDDDFDEERDRINQEEQNREEDSETEEESSFGFPNLAPLSMGIGALAITMVVTFIVLDQFKTTTGSSQISNQVNVTGGFPFINDVAGWVPLIMIATIGAVFIGVVGLFRGVSDD